MVAAADVLIEPAVEGFSMIRAGDRESIIEAGRKATVDALPSIRAGLARVEAKAK